MKKNIKKTVATIQKLDKWKCRCGKFHTEQTYEQLNWINSAPQNTKGMTGSVEINCAHCGALVEGTSFNVKPLEVSSGTKVVNIGGIATFTNLNQ